MTVFDVEGGRSGWGVAFCPVERGKKRKKTLGSRTRMQHCDYAINNILRYNKSNGEMEVGLN